MIAFLHFCEPGEADGFLSPNSRTPIAYRGHTFGSATHLIACLEARFFCDSDAEVRVRMATSPKAVQAAAARVRRPVVLEQAWQSQQLLEIAYAQQLKFEQHPELQPLLLATGDALLAYAHAGDRVLGIGVPDTHPNACRPERWTGRNLLGVALTIVRAQLAGRAADVQRTAIAS